MSFRKRNTIVTARASTSAAPWTEKKSIPGVRPSPLDGRPTTSTGTASLDAILAGHSGLPLGTCLLLEEDGTTDFSGALLRYYAAEGLAQGHMVHALALHPGWKAELPGISTGEKQGSKAESSGGGKMKIAWRYEALSSGSTSRDPEKRDTESPTPFCHTFDLRKRLSGDSIIGEIFFTEATSSLALPLSTTTTTSPFKKFIQDLSAKLSNSALDEIHRAIIPSILSPMLYTPATCRPSEVLQLLHSLRSLLRQYPTQLSAMITLPLSLHPRSSGLTRWMEHLCDGVMELSAIRGPVSVKPHGKTKEEQMQGLFKVHTFPVFHERGGGGPEGHAVRDNLSFSLSASKGLVIKPYSLPPMEEEEEKKGKKERKREGIEF